MKRILSLFLTLIFTLSCVNINVGAKSTETLSVSAPVSATAGETIYVTVNIPDGTNAANGSFNLVYDSAALKIVSCTGGAMLSGSNVVINKTYDDSKIRMSFNGDEPISGGGIILNASFQVLSGASGTVTFDVEKFKLFDVNYESISVPESATTSMYIVNDAKTQVCISCADTVYSGEELTVNVDISDAHNVFGGGLNFVYDADVFELKSATAGSTISAFAKQLNKNYAINKVRLTWAGSSAIAADGPLMKLVFTAKDGITKNARFEVENLRFADVNGVMIGGAATYGETSVICTHKVMEWKVTTQPTCLENGIAKYMCNCSYASESRTVMSTGHSMEWEITQEATCGEAGIKSYMCKSCSYVETMVETEAHGHTYKAIITAPTQSEQGYTTNVCEQCGHNYKDSFVPALGYTVKYDVNGGKETVESQHKNPGENISITDVIPTREGYTFLGWSANKNSDTAEYPSSGIYSADADVTLYAIWSINSFTVTYIIDGEEFAVQSYEYGSLIEAVAEPAKEGYTFSGWQNIPITMPAENITLSGTYSINSYTVKFDANGGETDIEDMIAEHMREITLPQTVPTKGNLLFLGWSETKNSRKAEYSPSDTVLITKDMVLYAVWISVWDGSSATGFKAGKGTKSNPYIIDNASQLKYLSDMVNTGNEDYSSAYYILSNNIVLNDISDIAKWSTSAPSQAWVPIGSAGHPFKGVFDGNGYTVTGIYINQTATDESASYQGLFGYAEKASLLNLGVRDGYIYGYDYVGGIVGKSDGSFIKNCFNECTVSAKSLYCGGIVGMFATSKSDADISGCYNSGNVSGKTKVGGVAGYLWEQGYALSVSECYNTGDISGTTQIGGVFGNAENTTLPLVIKNCHNEGTISGDRNIGGIVGIAAGITTANKVQIKDSYNKGAVEGITKYVGGIIGYTLSVDVLDCYNSGAVTLPVSGVDETDDENYGNCGGIAGMIKTESQISDCYNTGLVSGNRYNGGVAGFVKDSTVTDCYNKANVQGRTSTGGVVGYGNNAFVSKSYNHAPIGGGNTTATTGGVCGYLVSSTAELCYNTGDLVFIKNGATYAYDIGGVAGFAGYGSSIRNSYNVGDITATQAAGGIVGAMYYKSDSGASNVIENCLNTGAIKGHTITGGICAYMLENSTITRCLSIGQVTSNSDVGALTGTLTGKVQYSYYLSGCGPATSGSPLTWEQMRKSISFQGFSDGTVSYMHENWEMGSNPFMSFPTLKNNQAFTLMPIEFELNGGVFDEHVYSARIYANAVNAGRARDALVVYNTGTTTGTNAQGFEVIVNNRQKVIAMGGNNNEIPSGGIVLSGHGASDEWLKKNIEVGDKVYFDSSDYEIKVLKKNPTFTYCYGWETYLPTPHKEGYVFGGWYDEEDNQITYSTDIKSSSPLKLTAKWIAPDLSDISTYENHSYIVCDVPTSYESAKRFCESLGGHLATVTSAKENDFITSILPLEEKSFILGARDWNKEGSYQWDTGEAFKYSNWLSGEPNNANPGEDVLVIVSGNGFWNDHKDTYLPVSGFICEIDNFVPVGEVTNNGHKYQLFNNNISWHYAKAYCQMLGGHLVTITDENEQSTVMSLINTYNKDTTNFTHYWLGATKDNDRGEIEWVTNEQYDYTCIDKFAGTDTLWLDISAAKGTWHDYRDTYPYMGFICEFEPEEVATSGVYENISWAVENGALQLSGKGAVSGAEAYPWDVFDKEITTVEIAAGITDIGKALQNLTGQISSIVIPKSVTKISDNFDDGQVEAVTYAGSAYDWSKVECEDVGVKSAVKSYLECTIMYDGIETVNIANGSSVCITDKVPEKTGKRFLGWSNLEDATEAKYVMGDVLTADKDIILYPVWGKPIYTATYITAAPEKYGEWSAWSKDEIEPADDLQVEKRYRHRKKQKTTSDTKTLDGWIYYATSSTGFSPWKNNGTTPVPAVNTDNHVREVKREFVPAVIKNQYRYGRWRNTANSMAYYCAGVNPTNFYVEHTEWMDTPITPSAYNAYSCSSDSSHSHIKPALDDGKKVYWNIYVYGGGYFYWEEVSTTKLAEEHYVYYYRDNYYTHHFYRYTDWSEWQSTYPTAAFDELEIEYRSRKIDGEAIFKEENEGSINVTAKIPESAGYLFVGWATTPDATETEYVAGETIEVTDNISLYAVWTEGGSGSDESGISWQVENNRLTFTGKGEIADYSQGTAPWYQHKEKITEVVIAETVTAIGDYAFYGLDKVTSVDLGGVTKIGEYAFSNCSSLGELDTENVTEIGSFAFRYCSALSEVIISADKTKYGTNVYSNCSGITVVNISESTTQIPEGILNNCGIIDVLHIPDSVSFIHENAFRGTEISQIYFEGMKDEFAVLLTTKNTLVFDKVNCTPEMKTYLYEDFFVEIIPLESLSFAKKSVGLYIGENTLMDVNIAPANTTEKLLWISENEEVVTVDMSGNVTAVGEGVAKITVMSESGLLKAECTVYVMVAVDETIPVITVDGIEEIKNGEIFDVNISLKNNPGITSMRLNLAYDTSVMELTDVTDAGVLGDSLHSEDYSGNEYVLYWDNGTSKTDFTVDGNIATLTFKVKDNASSGDYPLTISYKSQDIINSDIIPVSFDVVNGFVTVKAFTYGDVNSDESVDTIDSAYLSRHIARWSGIAINPDASDVNKDKKVNVLDSAILKRYIANWPDYRTLPYIEPISLLSDVSVRENTNAVITVSDVKGQAGKTVDVTVSVENNPGLVNMRLDVNYDKDIMTLTKVSDTGLLPGEVHGNELSEVPYCLYWDNGTSKTDYTVNGDLVTLTFTLKENVAEGNYPINVSYNYNEPDIINTLLKPVGFDIDNGEIEVVEVIKPQMAVSDITVGEKTSFTLQLLSPDEISGFIVVATYDKGTYGLCKIEKYDAMSQRDFSLDTKNGEFVKIMWWGSFENLKPVADSVLVNEE